MTDLHRWPRRAARWVLVPRDPASRRPLCPSRVPAPAHRSRAANICTLTWAISSGRAARCRTLTTMSIAATTRKSTPRRTPARSIRSTSRSVPLDSPSCALLLLLLFGFIVPRTFRSVTPPSRVPRRKIRPIRSSVSYPSYRFIPFLDN